MVLLIMVLVWRKMEKKSPIRLSGKMIGTTLLGIAGALLLGVEMCLTMVWSNMILGIVIGIVGIVLLLCDSPYQRIKIKNKNRFWQDSPMDFGKKITGLLFSGIPE